MSDIVIEEPLIAAIPPARTDAEFPVRRISSIGRSSAVRLVEMGHDPDCELPIVLQKYPYGVDTFGQIPVPQCSKDVQHTTKKPVARKCGRTSISLEPGFVHVYGDGCRNIRIWQAAT